MRIVALVSLALLFAAPDLTRRDLDPSEVERFVRAAEEIAVVSGSGRVPPPDGAEEILRRHGFDPAGWQVTARRVWTAYDAQRIAPALDGRHAAKKLRALTGGERQEMQEILAAARGDLAFIAAESERDRAVITPWLSRLDSLAD